MIAKPESRRCKLSVAILAGGQSSRMGTDKALLRLDQSQTFLERIDSRLSLLATDRFVVNRSGEPYAGVHLRTLPDLYGDTGVLGAIGSAIRHSVNDRVFVVSCDMPFVNPAVVQLLLGCDEDADAVVPVTCTPSRQRQDHTWQVLHGIYRESCLPAIERSLDAGDRQAIAFLDHVCVRPVDESRIRTIDPDLLTFTSVNSPEDLRRARVLAKMNP